MAKTPQALLTSRQIEILRLRRQGLTQKEVAERLNTTRENVNILENRAYRNIRRATATLELLNSLQLSTRFTIPAKTPILEIPRMVLDKADEAKLRVKSDCIEILERIKSKARNKIRHKHLVKPLTITLLLDGEYTVE
ncbi:Tfx family DNA-binding protein [Candidatus Hecatella orcuttiae]|jgi:hypothetical protein|uniref:Tfx family DNA-binding protein n=1 Tax=Candidatus Hecatella orcuttiae TaxID=1935119 RepID=UPI002867EDA6|nr:Tfx family DNA-binding protein [Candidatus Hecatella orcuttiae]